MIINLFSAFDPSSSLLSSVWLILILVPILVTNELWNNSMPLNNTIISLTTLFQNEVKFSIGNTEKGSEIIIISLFIVILFINFPALYPQVFSTTSHVSLNLPLALTFWLSLVLFGWLNNTNNILIHLTPQGTPGSLINFIVVIELTSNLIRPITLCVRLTANIIAGHLLIILLGEIIISSNQLMTFWTIPGIIILTVLESAVAIIQAYVFMTLITLYLTESN